ARGRPLPAAPGRHRVRGVLVPGGAARAVPGAAGQGWTGGELVNGLVWLASELLQARFRCLSRFPIRPAAPWSTRNRSRRRATRRSASSVRPRTVPLEPARFPDGG